MVSKWVIFQIINQKFGEIGKKLVIFTMMYFYELKEMQSIEHSVKMSHFSNYYPNFGEIGQIHGHFHAGVFLRIGRNAIDWA